NGFVERMQQTIFTEHWRVVFRRHSSPVVRRSIAASAASCSSTTSDEYENSPYERCSRTSAGEHLRQRRGGEDRPTNTKRRDCRSFGYGTTLDVRHGLHRLVDRRSSIRLSGGAASAAMTDGKQPFQPLGHTRPAPASVRDAIAAGAQGHMTAGEESAETDIEELLRGVSRERSDERVGVGPAIDGVDQDADRKCRE